MHIHVHEHETFAIVAGTLRIWIDGRARDLVAGEQVTVPPRVAHRFLNPSPAEPVVVDVSLDGTLQEDMLVPLAYHLEGRAVRLRDLFVMIAHDIEVGGSRPPSSIANAVYRTLGRMLRLLGARRLPRAGAWRPAPSS